MRVPLLSLSAVIVPLALADVQITSPAAGASLPAGPMTVTWTEGDGSPSLDLLLSYTIQLMVGGNTDTDSQPVYTAPVGQFADGNSFQATIPAGAAGNTPNGFYIKIMSVAKEGGQVINFSNRFSMTGMTGTTPAAMIQAAAALGGSTAARDPVNNANQGQAAGGNNANGAGGGADATPYNEQSGLTKYAPMQPIPPTKITVNQYTPLFPTSAYTVATAPLALPSIQTTVTASQTYSVSSMENTAAPQSMPTGDMAKFLARWKD